MSKKNLFEMLRSNRGSSNPVQVQEETRKPSFVMEEFSLEDVYYSKTYTFRMDTLLMAGVLATVLLTISFFLGRLSVPSPEPVKGVAPNLAQKEEKQVGKQLAKAPQMNLPMEQPSSQNQAGMEKPPVDRGGKYHLAILTSPTEKGAQDAVDFLIKKGHKAFVAKRGRRFQVRIGGFEKMDISVRNKIRSMNYKGGNWFSSAMFIRVKS